jgi:tRNA (mo5U34)-methyltransferase
MSQLTQWLRNRRWKRIERRWKRVEQCPWFHSIDLGNGHITPGRLKTPEIHRLESSAFFDPINLEGSSVIDIGALNGFYSFEAKRRGAKRVLAVDLPVVWNDPPFCSREAFNLARSVLGLKVETLAIDVHELSPKRVGTFDVVLFLGVFYHLLNPIDGLARVAKLAKEVLLVETHVDLLDYDRPGMVFYPGSELANDASNWWGPNPLCMIALLNNLGFAKVDAAYSPLTPGAPSQARAIFHAWRSQSRRRLGPSSHLIIPQIDSEANRRRIGEMKGL